MRHERSLSRHDLLTDLEPATTTSRLGSATAMTGMWQQGTQGVPQHLRRRKITRLPAQVESQDTGELEEEQCA